MPLPQDERIIALANDLLQQFDQLFGLHPRFSSCSCKGCDVDRDLQAFSRSTHAHQSSAHTARLHARHGALLEFHRHPSDSDNAPDANPRGFAIRFNLAEHVHTDIIGHSTDGFPTRTGQEFLELLHAIATSGPDVPSPKPVEVFLGAHPAALAWVQAPKPFPSSFARDSYFGVTAFAFTNAAGETKLGRYRILPEYGNDYVADASSISANYHFDEIAERIAKGPIRFKIIVQIAAPDDVTDDATIHWPETRELLELGTVELTALVPDNATEQKQIIFDPIPRVDGIEPSADPLLELRAAIYLLSGRRRRAAKLEEQPA